MGTEISPAAIVDFWRAAGPDRWFEADARLDHQIRECFLAAHEAAAADGLAGWETSATGVLALLLLLDQFPRNMFRGSARAFATDSRAREVARRAIACEFDQKVDPALRTFFFMPFMHSENLADQEYCLVLYRAAGDTEGIKYAEIHLDAIRRFGRFPHRNKVLGRRSTSAETDYLEGGGFAG